jgi:ribA/ribD-fused uncharacterized protein
LICNDLVTADLVLKEKDPRAHKALGRSIKNYDDVAWSNNRFQIMVDGLFGKFSQDANLRSLLLGTGNRVLVEASPLDTVWGVGLGEDDPLILNEKNWRGQNLLGNALMRVRTIL